MAYALSHLAAPTEYFSIVILRTPQAQVEAVVPLSVWRHPRSRLASRSFPTLLPSLQTAALHLREITVRTDRVIYPHTTKLLTPSNPLMKQPGDDPRADEE